MTAALLDLVRSRLSSDLRQRIGWRLRRLRRPVLLGTLGNTRPVSREWGFDRGQAVDRYYIESFLQSRREDIRGSVLEVRDSSYTERFGSGVTHSHVLDIDPHNTRATLVGDLASGDGLHGEAFDCFVLTQTLHLIFDVRGAVAQAWRLLRPGGVLLASFPVTSRLYRLDSDMWRFTPASVRRLLEERFGAERLEIRAYGNVLSGIAFLAGMAAEELRRDQLDDHDPLFPLVVCARAVRASS